VSDSESHMTQEVIHHDSRHYLRKHTGSNRSRISTSPCLTVLEMVDTANGSPIIHTCMSYPFAIHRLREETIEVGQRYITLFHVTGMIAQSGQEKIAIDVVITTASCSLRIHLRT